MKSCVGALQQSTLDHACSLIVMFCVVGLTDANYFPMNHSCDV